jgi:replicative DNA helicase
MAEENIDEAAQAVRRPPSSVLSEQAILAGLMIDNSALDSVVDIIRPEDFYRRDHRIIFEEIVQLLQEGHPADYLTVFESLKSKGIENDAGGLPYLTELVGSSPSAANIRRYAEIVHDKSVLRQLITVGDRIVTNALAPEGRETREILDEAEKEVLAINERNARTQRGFQPLVTLVRDVSARVIDGEHFLFSFVQNFTCHAAFWRQCIGNDAVAYGNELAQYRLVMHDFRISADIRGRGRAPHQFGEIRQPARIVLNPL